MTKTSKIDAEDQMTRTITPKIKANLDHQINFKALGAIPKIRKSGLILDSEAENVGKGPRKSKADKKKLLGKAVVNMPDTISKNIENGRGLMPIGSKLLDLPKLSLRQPSITGYMEKTAEKDGILDPILSPKKNIENIGEVNIIQHQTNIDNIECEFDQYSEKISSLNGQNIMEKSAQLSIDPPGRELKWKSFSDILSTGLLVRLPNPTNKNTQSEGDSKMKEKKKRRRLKKKEEDRAQNCTNPISRYFPKVEVSMNQNGKRKCQSPNLEISKKKRS